MPPFAILLVRRESVRRGLMGVQRFPESTLAGECLDYHQRVSEIRQQFGFDFVSIGLTAFVGAPLKWLYSSGATGERHKRIALAPGHGIGGIVIKSGKPMMLLDIDRDLDPREYSSYPIVFAEDLRSFCALPLKQNGDVVGALLCAFRSVRADAKDIFESLIEEVRRSFCDFEVVVEGFMSIQAIAAVSFESEELTLPSLRSDLTSIIAAQEEERMRISRELHDGVAQELLTVSFLTNRLRPFASGVESDTLFLQIDQRIESIIEELRTMSVTLRPSALDHLGLLAAIRSHGSMLEKRYGAEVVVEGSFGSRRFDPAYETQVYRICQEAMLNACKYSTSDEILVEVDCEDNFVVVAVSDNGVGFDAENPEIKGTGCGLLGMRERARLIGADLDIVSGPDGTTVSLRAPLGTKEGGSAAR